MSEYIIAYDLGTGGNKASLYDTDGNCLGGVFESYETLYPQAGWHEQRPLDWWDAIEKSTRKLTEKLDVEVNNIKCCAISGHSLGIVPLDKDGNLLRDAIPIWSDSRPSEKQTKPFFDQVPEEEWYMLTGNGFPAPLYSVFKIMWLKDNEPEVFNNIYKVIGTKDFINFKMTGRMATDYSYASGSGVYDLKNWKYSNCRKQ